MRRLCVCLFSMTSPHRETHSYFRWFFARSLLLLLIIPIQHTYVALQHFDVASYCSGQSHLRQKPYQRGKWQAMQFTSWNVNVDCRGRITQWTFTILWSCRLSIKRNLLVVSCSCNKAPLDHVSFHICIIYLIEVITCSFFVCLLFLISGLTQRI